MRSALIWTSVFFVSLVVGFLIRPASGERAELHPDEPPPVLVEPSLPDEAHRSTSEPQADDFDAALEAIPIPDLAPAKAPITGRVIDPDDQGVAGVRIIARPVLEAASDEALADRVVAWAVSERLEPATIEATTDADGFFALSPLLRASYEITAEREDLSILPSTPIENPARPGDWVTFVAHRGIPYEIEIDVIAPGGSRASDAYVVVREPGERDSFFRSLRPWVANHEQLESSPFGLAFHWTPSSRLFRVRFDCEIEA
ncbi:MAG TPA: carboxypeptidase-like regulatory domain-containing protein, partial [Planctomycetota bacterium]|nr:carboxypeptidase-like regulatory domain-containing protein [Planctomycetota bacterium]